MGEWVAEGSDSVGGGGHGPVWGTGCKAGNAVVLHRGSRHRRWELVVNGEFVAGLRLLAVGLR